MSGERERVEVADVALDLADHVIVPLSVIAMVTALLFFLADLRSVFLPDSFSLKWLGFCFGVATVLIARYGRRQSDRADVYTGLLGAAVLIALVASPWEPPGVGLMGPLLNALIILVVWRFATRLTRSLAYEDEEKPASREPRFYGVQRLEVESFENRRREGRSRQDRPRVRDDHNPSAAVARWVLVGMVIFAVGEPILLAGPPEVGVRALVAMIVFLLASGVVLAAGSTVGTAKRVRQLEGRVDRHLLPGRLVITGGLLLVLLTLVLAVPGITYRGTGDLEPGSGGEVTQEGESESDSQSGDEPEDGADQGSAPSETSPDSSPQVPSGAVVVLDFLQAVGRWLWVPVVIAVVLGGAWLLARLAPFLAAKAGTLSGWRALLARLAAALARRRRDSEERQRRRTVDLRADDLGRLAPGEAVVLAYERFLGACEARGFGREKKQTPYEFLARWPRELGGARGAAEELTELYVRAAYGGEEMGEKEKGEVVAVIGTLGRDLGVS